MKRFITAVIKISVIAAAVCVVLYGYRRRDLEKNRKDEERFMRRRLEEAYRYAFTTHQIEKDV